MIINGKIKIEYNNNGIFNFIATENGHTSSVDFDDNIVHKYSIYQINVESIIQLDNVKICICCKNFENEFENGNEFENENNCNIDVLYVEYLKNHTKILFNTNCYDNFFIRILFENPDIFDSFEIKSINIFNHSDKIESIDKIIFLNKQINYDIYNNDASHTQNETDLISVIIPAYNVEEYITTAIDSIYKQTYKNWEIIIINDCSTDDTLNVINSHYNNIDNINIVNNIKNVGKYWSINLGILLSNGKYITFLDGDDVFDPNKLYIQHSLLKKSNKPACFTKYARYKNGKSFKIRICPNSILYDKKIIDFIGFFDSVRFAADTEFYERIKKYTNNNVIEIDNILYHALHRENSLTTAKNTDLKSDSRLEYFKNFRKWHKNSNNLYINFPIINRPFKVHNINKI